MGRGRGRDEGNRKNIFQRYAHLGSTSEEQTKEQRMERDAHNARMAEQTSRNTSHAQQPNIDPVRGKLSPESIRRIETMPQAARTAINDIRRSFHEQTQPETTASRVRAHHQSAFSRYAPQSDQVKAQQRQQERQRDKGDER